MGISQDANNKAPVNRQDKKLTFIEKKSPAQGGAHNYSLAGFAVGAEDVDYLVDIHLLHLLAGGLEILPGIKVAGVLYKVLADGCGHCETAVGVDVDFTDSALGGLAELLLGDTDCVGEVAAVLVAHVNIFLRDGR